MKQSRNNRILIGMMILLATLCFCVASSAAGSGDCGKDVHWELNDAGDLRIYGTGPMDDFGSTVGQPWYNKGNIKTAVIEEGVTSIGDRAFHNSCCENLTKITIASSVTRIGKFAFYGDKFTEAIRIPDNLETIDTSAFKSAKVTFRATVGSKGAKTISKDGHSFLMEGGIWELQYEFDGDEVKHLTLLSGASKDATAVEIPKDITKIGDEAFRGYSKLASVTIPASVTCIGGFAFDSCISLTGISLPAGLTELGHEAFYSTPLTSITIPSGIKRIERGTFAGCSEMTSIALPDGLEFIGEAAFYHCQSMKSITIPSGVTKIDRLALADCGFTEIVLPDSVKELGEYVFHDDPDLVSVRLSPNIYTLPFNAFNMCKGLEEITLPSGMRSIASEAFSVCPKLKKVVIPDSVIYMNNELFKDSENVVIYCSKNSRADLYAKANNIKVVYTGPYVPPETGGDLQAGETKSFDESYEVVANLKGNPYATSSDESIAKVKTIAYRGIVNNKQLVTIEIEAFSPGLCIIELKGETNEGQTVTLWKKITVVSGKMAVYTVTVTVSDKEAGTASADPESGYADTDITLSYTENAGWKFKNWLLVSGGVTIADNKFTLGKENVEIKAVFERDPSMTDLSGAKIGAIKDQAYSGKAVKPKLSVICNGKTLTAGTDYSAEYSNNTDIGRAAVTITGIGKYYGTKSASFTIIPKKVTLSSPKAGKKKLTIKWKAGKGIDGYEIEYSLKKDFKVAKKITVKKAKTTSYVIKKLKAKTTYYVRIRAFKKVKGKKYYSEWSKVQKKDTK